MLKSYNIVKMLKEVIDRLSDKDKERAYQICMFLLIDHIPDDYREKFLENFSNAVKIYQTCFSDYLEKSFVLPSKKECT